MSAKYALLYSTRSILLHLEYIFISCHLDSFWLICGYTYASYFLLLRRECGFSGLFCYLCLWVFLLLYYLIFCSTIYNLLPDRFIAFFFRLYIPDEFSLNYQVWHRPSLPPTYWAHSNIAAIFKGWCRPDRCLFGQLLSGLHAYRWFTFLSDRTWSPFCCNHHPFCSIYFSQVIPSSLILRVSIGTVE